MNKRKIGVFDSGVGGLTVMSEIIKLLPNEDIIYFGDTAHVPYGSKSPEAVQKYSSEIASFLISKKIKMLVVACNTASAFALPMLRRTLDVPVIGVIGPGSKAAASVSHNGRIGVIGTEGTIISASYSKAISEIRGNTNVFERACPLFVPLVEEGWLDHKITEMVVVEYLKPLIKKNIDTLVLGCTHYPLIKKVIGKAAGRKIRLIDSAVATAAEVKNVLFDKSLYNTGRRRGRYTFYVSDAPKKFRAVGEHFLGCLIDPVKKVVLKEV